MKAFGWILIVFGSIGGIQAASWFFGYVSLEADGNPFSGGLLVLAMGAAAIAAGLIAGGVAMINTAKKNENEINWNALTDEQKLVKQQQILDRAEEQRKLNEQKAKEWADKTHWQRNKVAYIVIPSIIISPAILAAFFGVFLGIS